MQSSLPGILCGGSATQCSAGFNVMSTQLRLYANAQPGFSLVSVTGDCVRNGDGYDVVISMPVAKACTFNFVQGQWSLLSSSETFTSVSARGSQFQVGGSISTYVTTDGTSLSRTFAVSSNNVVTSGTTSLTFDGKAVYHLANGLWVRHTLPLASFETIAALAVDSTGRLLVTTTQTPPPGNTWTATVSTLDQWMKTVALPTNATFSKLRPTGSFIALLNNALYRTADGTIWSAVDGGTGTFTDAVFRAPNTVIVSGSTLMQSIDDGLTFAPATAPTGIGAGRLADNGSTFVLVKDTQHLANSSLGATWSAATITCPTQLAAACSTPIVFNDVAWNGTRFMAVGASNLIATSTDGQTWAVVSYKPSYFISDVASDGTTTLLATGSGVLNAADFTPVPTAPTVAVTRIIYDTIAARFVAYDTNGVLWYSTPTGWQSKAVNIDPDGAGPAVACGKDARDLIRFGTKYLLAGVATSKVCAVDVDLTNNIWAPSAAVGTRSLLALGASSTVVVTNSSSTVYSSTDGITWSASSVATTGGASFIRAAPGPTGLGLLASYPNTFFASTDGQTWSAAPTFFAPTTPDDLLWDGARWVASGYTVMLTSPDGMTWSQDANPAPNTTVKLRKIGTEVWGVTRDSIIMKLP